MSGALPSPSLPALLAPGDGVLVELPGVAMLLPSVVGAAGDAAAMASVEFFTARLRNNATRRMYLAAVRRFCAWLDAKGLPLSYLANSAGAATVSAYLEELRQTVAIPTANMHLSVLRAWLGWLVQRGVLSMNPAASVRGERYAVDEGKTPILEREEAKRLLASLDDKDGDGIPLPRTVLELRDRALICLMLFNFVRVGAAVKMRVRDFEDGPKASIVLHEKRGKERRLPAHRQVADALRAYLDAAGVRENGKDAWLFQSLQRADGVFRVTGNALHTADVWAMVKRRCKAVGLPSSIGNHSLRATGITVHQENGGTLEAAAKLAGHASTRTTQLYSRAGRHVARDEVDRVQL